MAERHLIAPAAFAGDVAHWWEDDGEGGGLVHSVQDVAPIVERNKALYTANDGYSASRELRRVAFIPHVVRQKWLNEEGWDAYRPDLYPEKLAAKLNDPEWRFLRTAPGQLGVSNGKMR